MTVLAEPQEAEVLRAIGDLFARPRSAAALAHYPTLRIQTTNLRAALNAAIEAGEQVAVGWSERLAQDQFVASEFRAATAPLHSYRIIAPALIRNLNRTAGFLLDEARPVSAVHVDRVGETVPSFSDFVRLGAAARVFLDALVQTAFQLVAFDGRQLNYKFLQSLQGFAPVAPPSLHGNIYSPEIQAALTKFASMSSAEIKSSQFVTRSNEQFGQRLKVSGDHVGLVEQRRRNVELLYSFCSDFVHSGYVSTIAVGEASPGFVMGGPGDAFTPDAENFAELKQRLLGECAGAYADLLVPALLSAIGRMLCAKPDPAWVFALNSAAGGVKAVRAVLNRALVEPMREGLVGSDATIGIDCVCGAHADWRPPHHEWDAFAPIVGLAFAAFPSTRRSTMSSHRPALATSTAAMRRKSRSLNLLCARSWPGLSSGTGRSPAMTGCSSSLSTTLPVATRTAWPCLRRSRRPLLRKRRNDARCTRSSPLNRLNAARWCRFAAIAGHWWTIRQGTEPTSVIASPADGQSAC